MRTTYNKELHIEKLVKSQADFLIQELEKIEPMMEAIFKDNTRIEYTEFGNSQIRNLLKAASQASGVNEIVLYIQYQIGRDNSRNIRTRTWNRTFGKETLGEAVIAIIRNIERKSKEVSDGDDELHRDLVLRLIERFLNYWTWKYSYLSTTMGGGRR